MPIETPKLNPSTIALPQPGNTIYFVGTDGLLKIKDDTGAIIDFHGTDGNTVLNGPGVPANSLGKAGDFTSTLACKYCTVLRLRCGLRAFLCVVQMDLPAYKALLVQLVLRVLGYYLEQVLPAEE